MKRLLLYFLVALATTSCEHKDLCYNHIHNAASVKVIFDWKNVPDADPASMSLYLFPKNGSKPERYEFTKKEGGIIRVIPGIYDAICINSDTEGIVCKNTDKFETFEISTQTSELLTYSLQSLGVPTNNVPRAEGSEDERTALSSDMLWYDVKSEIMVTTEEENVIILAPSMAVCNYQVQITNVENAEYVTGLSAVLSGMAGGLLPALNTVTSEVVAHPFDMKISKDKTSVSGSLLTFGHCPNKQGQHTLIVYAVLTDGSKFAYSYDTDEITKQIHEAPDPRNVIIYLDGLKLPGTVSGGGGFHPEVGDWEEIEVEIEM